MQLTQIGSQETTSPSHSLLEKQGSKRHISTRKWIIIIFISVIITAMVSVSITYFVMNNNDNNTPSQSIDGEYDIIIVGAGSTGLIQAKFLLDNDPNIKILILEQLSRIGGRQFTSFAHKIDIETGDILNSIHFENCAMRFYSDKPLTVKLMSYLNLCDDIIPFSMDRNVSNQIYNFRNSRILGRDLYHNDSSTISYYSSIFNVNNNELLYLDGDGSGSNKIWQEIFDRIIEENGGITPITEHDWYIFRNNYTLNGDFVYKWGDDISRRIIGNFSNELIDYANIFNAGSRTYNRHYSVNLAQALFESFHDLHVRNVTIHNPWTLRNGYDSMAKVLYDMIIKHEESDSNVLLSHKVTSIRYSDSNYRYLVESNYGINKYAANKIILSIPPDSMINLLPYIEMMDNQYIRDMLDSFIYMDSVKINLIYDSSFWINDDLQRLMPSNTDLQIKEFYVENAWSNGTLTVIHIYTTGKHNRFWYGAQILGDKYPINNTLKIDDLDTLTIASTVVVEQIIKQLQQLIQKYIPLPMAAFINFWGKGMELQGTTRFKNGINIDKIINESNQPNKNEDIFIAISDFSYWGGVIESSISAALYNLKSNFGVNNPLQHQPICNFPQL